MKTFMSVVLVAAALSGCEKSNEKEIRYQVNGTSSKAEWNGAAPDHFHVGSFNVTGSLGTNSKGALKNGEFVIPISSIENYDLQDPLKQVLLDDLKSEHFFNMIVHPNAEFRITRVAPYNQPDTVQGANYLITGDFSMIGKTNSISFPAKFTTTPDSVRTEAIFKIDRTKWGMNIYNDPSKDLYILPDVSIHLKISAAKNK